ncbi:LysR family transcriptional regulator [Kiloniella antarctica]|uniref:LysR family transcriptional regulator n=1 Tax=Kiloniella antarctica TaxID=1550907 RepID=A0ABW5BM58_9PROT
MNWLRAFEASARHLSFTGAARELNMTQSAVSQQIKSLEQHLGHPMFIRQPRTLHLTEAGERYLPVIQDAFERLQSGTQSLTGGEGHQRLTIQCNMAFSIFWLAPRLPKLLDKHPWLSVNVVPEIWTTQTEPSASVVIRYGRSDVASTGENSRAERLSQGNFYPVCTPELTANADWRKDRLFDCSAVFCSWETWLSDQGLRLPSNQRVNLTSTYSITLTAAVNGAGLALGHDVLVQDMIDQGRLVKPFAHSVPMQEAYFLMIPARHSQTYASHAFIDWIQGEFV